MGMYTVLKPRRRIMVDPAVRVDDHGGLKSRRFGLDVDVQDGVSGLLHLLFIVRKFSKNKEISRLQGFQN
jgi:hypothetical protein